MPTVERVDFLSGVAYNPIDFRSPGTEDIGPGVYDRDSYRVTFNAGLTVRAAPGIAYVRGLSDKDQGMYRCYQSAAGGAMSVTLDAAPTGANPRIDQIVLQVRDSVYDAAGGLDAQVIKITGAESPGATLDNRLGAVDLTTISGPSVILLADVLVSPNNTPALSNTTIRDRRQYGTEGHFPQLNTGAAATDQKAIVPRFADGLLLRRFNLLGSDYAQLQSAALIFLPKRIAATKFRWKYQQDPTNQVGTGQSYALAICDASTRLIAQTGAVAFGGVGGAVRNEVPAFNPAVPAGYIFEIGYYWIWFGVTNYGATTSFNFVGAGFRMDNNKGESVHSPNCYLHTTGTPGVTFPANKTLLGFQDAYTDTSTGQHPLPVPQVVLEA